MDTRTEKEKQDNISKYEATELLVLKHLNDTKGPGYRKIYEPERKWDIVGPETYEVKSFKIGKHPCIPKDTFIHCKANYIAFVEVFDDEDATPTGKVYIVEWPKLRRRIIGDQSNGKRDWIQIKAARFVTFFTEDELIELPFVTTLFLN